ncbi:MAG: VWA domain-containing protein [Planctomycetota bacterium]|nr:MAG: VWA domain-containing protein [Planctomycetota bacterium]
MSLGAPAFLWLLALALPVIALYLLKVRRRRVAVPYLRLWESLVQETRAHSLFQRFKRLLSLLLQLVILAALVLAMGKPALELGALKEEHVVLLLDTSASMRARDAGGTRFDAMLERARALVEDLGHEDQMLVAAASDRLDVLAPFTRSRLRLRQALERARPTNRSLDAARALAFAREVTQDRPSARILFLSDGAAGGVESALRGLEGASLVPVGAPAENVGILRFSARKNSALGADSILAVLKNFGAEAQEFDLELALNGATQKVAPQRLAPGEESVQRFDMALPEGGTLRLSLALDDALALDNTAFAIARPDALRRIVLVTADPAQAQPFQLAFESMAEVVDPSSLLVTPEQYAGLDDELKRADVTICHGVLPPELPAGGNLVLLNTPLPAGLPARIVGEEPNPEIWDWDRGHLLNRYLNYRDLPLPPARILEVAGGEKLVESYSGPVIAAFDLGGRRAVYVAFDMTDRLFPFRLAFPLLLRNAVAWFESEADQLLEDCYRPGSVIRPLRPVSGPVSATWFTPEGQHSETLELRDGAFYFDRTELPGPYLFTVAGRDHPTSVNLFDAGESDLAPPAATAAAAPGRGAHLLNREFWTVLAALALGLWALEWALYHRRITE